MPFDLGYPPSEFVSSRPGYNGTSLQEAASHFSTEEKCIEHVLKRRFGDEIACSKCTRLGRWHRRSGAKHVQHSCGAVISPLAGTLVHATKLPLRLWFYAMLHFANSHEGVNAAFLGRHLGITYPAAFRMAQKIRRHMAMLDETAETVAPGQDIHVRLEKLHRVRGGPRSQNTANVLFVASEGRIDSAVIADPRRHTLRSAITKLMPGEGDLITTCHRTAMILSTYGRRKPLAASCLRSFLMTGTVEI